MARILIIEDDADIAAIERDYLALSGYDVTIKTDGPSGLQAADTLTVGPLTAEPEARRIFKNGTELPLKNLEYELLLFLIRHPGQVFSREDLYELIWGGWNPWAIISRSRSTSAGSAKKLRTIRQTRVFCRRSGALDID